MSIPSIGTTPSHSKGSIPPLIRAEIFNSLAKVITAYLSTIQKGTEKLAAQDAAQRKAKQKQAREAAINEEAIADAEKSGASHKDCHGSKLAPSAATSGATIAASGSGNTANIGDVSAKA